MQLNQLADNAGARRDRKRIGRGIGSGTGKTGGRGVKGQKSRSGVAIKGFEGGQMPIYRRLPKRGFKSLNRVELAVLNLSDLQKFVELGRISEKDTVTTSLLKERSLVRSNAAGVKILAKGVLKAKLKLEVDAASATAVEAIKKAGGAITTPDAA